MRLPRVHDCSEECWRPPGTQSSGFCALQLILLVFLKKLCPFFGRVHTNPTWTDDFVERCANLTWSTKNSSGIVLGGYLSGNVSNPRLRTHSQKGASFIRQFIQFSGINAGQFENVPPALILSAWWLILQVLIFQAPRCCRGSLMR